MWRGARYSSGCFLSWSYERGGRSFATVEHDFQVAKALSVGNLDVAAEITAAATPMRAKKIGNEN